MMNKRFVSLSLTLLLAVMLALFGFGVNSAAATHVTPRVVSGNPDCADLGYSFGFKIDTQVVGDDLTFRFTNGTQHTYPTVVTSGPQDPNNSVTISSDGVVFDWTSSLGIDAVIVKGGPNSNVYEYDPEETSDTGLTTPDGQDISHIEFCYDYELTASKTADAEFTRTYTWTITKSVDDDSHAGFTGDSFTSNYEVIVDQTVSDSAFAVSGTITVNNPTPFTVSFGVTDSVGGTAATVSCLTYSLAPGASTTCSYSASLGSKTNGTNTATITSNNSNVDGTTASANYAFGAPTTTVGYPTINVTDTLGGSLGSASGDKTFKYSVTFTCDEDEGENPNTATIVEPGQTASESVTVTCYELSVTKTANTSLTRTWTWTIDKSADQSELLLSEGQLFYVNYEVTVDATSVNSAWAVNGNISVNNPAPIPATITGVADVVSPSVIASVNCGVTFPYVLAAGGTLNCTYSASLPDATNRTNTATATLQNTPSGTTDFSHTVNVSFANATITEIDECIEVNDTYYGFGTICAEDAPKTLSYSLGFGANHPDADVQLECGDNSFTNTASFVTNDTEATGSDEWTVNANVACGEGCTLTQGYWKTHSQEGPAPYDDAWQNLGPDEEDTEFFLSGQTWYEVFWTAPKGNAYYNLAHQYMAATLNVLNGASAPPEVVAALASAETLFETYTPAQVAAFKGNNATRKQFIALASTLDKYNNGLIGPGHCSE